MIFQDTLRCRTPGRGTTDLTAEVERVVRASGVATGTCNVFLQHTSASLVLCEDCASFNLFNRLISLFSSQTLSPTEWFDEIFLLACIDT